MSKFVKINDKSLINRYLIKSVAIVRAPYGSGQLVKVEWRDNTVSYYAVDDNDNITEIAERLK